MNPNCIDITNLTSDQLDTLFNDLTTGKKTFKQAVAENPANTTECIAPILAQAKTEIANSGIIGK